MIDARVVIRGGVVMQMRCALWVMGDNTNKGGNLPEKFGNFPQKIWEFPPETEEKSGNNPK